jgi:hypothetical protein
MNILGQEFDLSGLEMSDALVGVAGKSGYVEAVFIDGLLSVTSLVIFDDYAVPGATPVFVSGVVTAADQTGRVLVGDIEVDVSATSGQNLAVGNSIAVTGTQPVPGGVILGESVLLLNSPDAFLPTAEAVRSITGSGQR